MSKTSSLWVCQQCGYESVGFLGKCPSCGTWSSLVETVSITKTPHSAKASRGKQNSGSVTKLNTIKNTQTTRTSTKISELDRVLGGGLVPGQVVLLAGEPGIGKSTILLQLADKLGDFLYISGEESANQIKIRADRLGVTSKTIDILEETDIDIITDTFKGQTFKGVVVDSIQTMKTGDLSGMAGSVGQVRECAGRLVRIAKSQNVPIILVGHATKEGTVAGPNVLMHIVDTVLWFEGEKNTGLRILRASKNRFGPTDEVGIFEMKDIGLESLSDPQKLFVTDEDRKKFGACIASTLQGTRPILVEIQSLVIPTKQAYPKRIALGVDPKRLEILLAVLSTQARIPLYEMDVFVNVVGGMKITETGCDLAVALSIASAYYKKSLPAGSVAIGEVELLGSIRPAPLEEKRIKEAKRLGYRNVISKAVCSSLSTSIGKFLDGGRG